MNLFFSSSYPAVLKVNGLYICTLNDGVFNYSCDNFNINKPPFIEICPLAPCENYICFFPDSSYINNPSSSVVVADLKGGYHFKFNKSYSGGEFAVINQTRLSDGLVTVFNENGKKISIETPYDFYIENLYFDFTLVNFYRPEYYNGKLLFIEFCGDNKCVAVYNLCDKIRPIFMRQVADFSIDDGFITTENYLDIAKHSVQTTWQFDGENFTVKDKVVSCDKDFNRINFCDKVIPYAFLESYLVGGEYKDYLCESIKENTTALSSYLGDFIGVMPPPPFRDINDVGVIYPVKKNYYQVSYFKFSVENGLILNLKKLDE
ncbi:MAG: hypothetical protein IJZ73_04940 [Clostridia bacterium]|nr:hypothetical protein [Clostridia bacterium]